MSVSIHIPTPLRQYVNGSDQVEIEGNTVAEVLERLMTEHDQLRKHLLNEDGALRSFVNLYLNDTDIRQLDQGETRTSDGDQISIVPSIAGGKATTATELPNLTHEKILRYSRHLILPEVGPEGQRRLKAARAEDLRARRRAAHERGPEKVDRRGPHGLHGCAHARTHDLSGQRSG